MKSYLFDLEGTFKLLEILLISDTLIYKREFPLISRTLFVESVYRRRHLYNQAVLDDFSAISSRKIDDVIKLLTTQADRMRTICKSNGVVPNAIYLHPETRLVPIIAGHSRDYITALQRLDDVYQLVGSATLNGLMDGSARMQMETLCRKAVRAFSAMLRNEILKLRKESQRMQQVNLGVRDEEVERAENAHGEAVEAFDASMQTAAALDSSAHVAPADAAEIIADISASTNAASRARAPRKAAEAAPQTSASPVQAQIEVTQ